jgi:hypothetical protein
LKGPRRTLERPPPVCRVHPWVARRAGLRHEGFLKRRTAIPTLTLSAHEQTLLRELLEAQRQELRHEIHRTDDYDYRRFLKEKAAAVKDLLQKVQAS